LIILTAFAAEKRPRASPVQRSRTRRAVGPTPTLERIDAALVELGDRMVPLKQRV
jgi:hypothetical protein